MTPGRPESTPGLRGRLQELKADRRSQVMLLVFACALGFLVWTLFSDPTPTRARKAAPRGTVAPSAPIPERQLNALERFASLARLGQAGELPTESRMFRDPFLFDAPPPPPRPVKPPPPPKPPSEDELRALKEQQDRAAEQASRPQSLRYLGYLERASVGRIGAFMRGEEPVTLRIGDLLTARPGETATAKWRLVSLAQTSAEFQNLKYPDLRHRLEATDGSAALRGSSTNQF